MAVRHCWRAINRDGFHLRAWDDESVVYDEFSGHTHLLSSFAGDALSLLCRQQAPLSAELLAEQLAAELEIDRGSEFDQALAASLDEFERLGLVERTEA